VHLALSPRALAAQLGARPFVALPREEIERHYACVELEVPGPGLAEIEIVAAFHHNHAWLTHRGPSLVLRHPLAWPERDPPLFLDEAIDRVAEQLVAPTIAPDLLTSWRLVGIIQDDGVGLVYVGRLKERLPPSSAHGVSGPGDLAHDRARYGPWSQILIEHIDAL
jgi:hypothetical protein